MKIVLLDGSTANPGDIGWGELEKCGEIISYTADPSKTYERSKDADILMTNKVPIDRELIFKLDKLKFISVIATGYNIVDLKAAREKGIDVSNAPNYCSESAAQLAFSHILELARNIGKHSDGVKKGHWSEKMNFCYWEQTQIELSGQILGIIGYGNIGSALARLGKAFGMEIIAFDTDPEKIKKDNFKAVSLDEIFKQSDFLSLHCPLTDENENLINKTSLDKMKNSAFLINASRGPLVNERDLFYALENGIIAGAGLDVLCIEPPPKDHILFKAKNCNISPHMAWTSSIARKKLIEITAQNVKAFLDGKAQNVVN